VTPGFERVCVFSGSNPGTRPEYMEAARAFGSYLADGGIHLICGGASVGRMGAVADGVIGGGGRVTGVTTRHLVAEDVAHHGLTELRVVDTMHERKSVIVELSEAFVVLPGGFGTIEEAFEVLTWTQLRVHVKPVGFLNVAGYFDPLLAFLDHALVEGFLRGEHREMVVIENSTDRLFVRLAAFNPPVIEKWIR
jgi:uncharacterized protein (TIGR00730 family)